MNKLVVLELGEGDFKQGFSVRLQIAEEGEQASTRVSGTLPPAPQVEESYQHWKKSYDSYCAPNHNTRIQHASAEIQQIGSDYIPDPRDKCQQAAEKLSETLNDWLESKPFKDIKEEFLTEVKPDEKIRIILQTDNNLLRNLPWNSWKLLTQS